MLKKFHWFELTLIALVMGVHLYAALSAPHNFPSRWFTRDDAYYYFKVAQNISEGRGSTFDGINLTNGYHPLWMLICIPIFALARIDLILPLRVLMLVMAALSVTTSILLFRLLKKETGIPAAILAASFWALNLEIHSIITQQGMETGIVALSIVLFLFLLQKIEVKPTTRPRDFVYLSLAALFVLFSRLDGIYLVLIGGIWLVFRKHPIRYLLPLDILLTFSIIVGAYIQRATLKVYLLAYDESAIVMTVAVLIIQTIVFYFTGLYSRPSAVEPIRLFIMSLVGVSVSAAISTLVIFGLAGITKYDLPRAVPVFYSIGMLGLTLISRFLIRFISPWPQTLTKAFKPSEGFLAGKNHIRAAIEPLGQWFQNGMIFFGIFCAGLLGYMGINLFLFGTAMPVSGQIKRWWGSLPNDVYGGGAKTTLDVFGIDPNNSQAWSLLTNPILNLSESLSKLFWNVDGWYWSIITFLIITITILFIFNRKKILPRIFRIGLIPLLISAELHVFFYGAMAYAAKHEWYWVMQMLALVISGAIIFYAVADLLPHNQIFHFIWWAVTAITSLYLAYAFSTELISRMPWQDVYSGEPYMDTMPILEGYTEPGAMIGMTGGGNSGYFIKDRTVINMDGLINSYEYYKALQNNQGGKYLARIGMDYIFANRYIITNTMPYRYQFSDDELTTVQGAPVYGQKELMRYLPK